MKTTKNKRGFTSYSFVDDDGYECSLQESSANGRKIWLGVDNVNETGLILAKDAHLMNIKTFQSFGWLECPILKEVLLHDRMHLTQKQVKKLLPALQYFAEHGYLPEE